MRVGKSSISNLFNMKIKNRIWICYLIVIGLVLILTNSCKKDTQTQHDKPSTITDGDDNVYNTVTIGTQTWMAENLKTTKYRNGDLIGTTTPATLDITGESTPKYQWAYDGNENNAATYGRLYTWYAITDTRNVCPTGWHIPTDTEWTTLVTFLGGDVVAGGKLKETGTTHWTTPNEGATNETGFTALPGGWRPSGGGFLDFGNFGGWWTSTETSIGYPYDWYASYKAGNVYNENDVTKQSGVGVRCLKDQ
jgi:uncharacterized protein (TIGR02145 family)